MDMQGGILATLSNSQATHFMENPCRAIGNSKLKITTLEVVASSTVGALKSMGIRPFSLTILIGIGIACSSAVASENYRLSPYDRTLEEAFTETDAFRPISILPALRAVYDPLKMSNVSETERLGKFAVVSAKEIDLVRAALVSTDQNDGTQNTEYFVGVDQKTQKRVLLTGNLIIKYSPVFDVNSAESVYPIQLIQDFPAIQTAFFRVSDEGALGNIQDGLRRNPGVIYAKMERIHIGKRAR